MGRLGDGIIGWLGDGIIGRLGDGIMGDGIMGDGMTCGCLLSFSKYTHVLSFVTRHSTWYDIHPPRETTLA
ncbi:hypothetical protein [Brevibacillus fluminis]|uniref:hypothetical protein n=1 Tax=Brevibacillus fluminis TaxID=511487 RepID=UPI001C831CCA|nr:hypothetical protein [Brevibacillus fluminis]